MKPIAWTLAATLVVAACSSPASKTGNPTTPSADDGPPSGAADTLVVGEIWTGNPNQPRATAMLVRDGEIAAVGDADALTAAHPQASRIDTGDGLVIPGVIDSHTHVAEMGAKSLVADLTGAESVEEIVARLRRRFPNPAPGQWVRGAGWDEGVWASLGYPDRRALDEAFPQNPVALASLHGFAGFYNGVALTAAGIDDSTPDPDGGTILRRADGSATGVLLTLAQQLVRRKIPAATVADHKRAILIGLQTVAAAGVTSVHEAGMSPARLQAFSELAEAGQLPVRVYGMLDGNDTELMAHWFERGPRTNDPWFSVRSIKVFYDGSLGSRTALLAAPYSDKPDAARPTERLSPAAVASLAERAAARGFQMAVHAIGDEANDRVLDLYERALAGRNLDHRWRVEHAQVVLSDYFERAAALGVVSSMQPSHAVGDSKWAEDRLGPERIRLAYAWQRVLRADGALIFNSDLPGEPWKPVETLWFAVTRAPLDAPASAGWYADQAVGVDRALRAMTVDSARAGFQESTVGSLQTGHRADFVVLEPNPFDVPVEALRDTRVTATYIDGRRFER